jgi:hypothetical protein
MKGGLIVFMKEYLKLVLLLVVIQNILALATILLYIIK